MSAKGNPGNYIKFQDPDRCDIVTANKSKISIDSEEIKINNRLKATGDLYSAGDLIISGTVQFPEQAADQSAHIIAPNTHLILSSSAFPSGTVTISGALRPMGHIYLDEGQQLIFNNNPPRAQDTYIKGASANRIQFVTDARPVLKLGIYQVIVERNSILQSFELILSSTNQPDIVCSSSMRFNEPGQRYHVRTTDSDLILSSSTTSIVAISGNLHIKDIPTADPSIPGALYSDGGTVKISS